MKGGVAVGLKLAAGVPDPDRDVTYVFYEAEEIEAEHNGLYKLSISHPELMQADFAILMEPSNGVVEAGRSEEHTSELQSLMRISYAVFCLKKKTNVN